MINNLKLICLTSSLIFISSCREQNYDSSKNLIEDEFQENIEIIDPLKEALQRHFTIKDSLHNQLMSELKREFNLFFDEGGLFTVNDYYPEAIFKTMLDEPGHEFKSIEELKIALNESLEYGKRQLRLNNTEITFKFDTTLLETKFNNSLLFVVAYNGYFYNTLKQDTTLVTDDTLLSIKDMKNDKWYFFRVDNNTFGKNILKNMMIPTSESEKILRIFQVRSE